ncbi:MAG TPA: NTP transferase domain-containing protein [Microbacteriaceae bacterium]|nr:NTP transferase domain-containing protein [Microbacteriaceae bacterium]
MIIDAIVLAGGRSSRLSGRPKSALLYQGATLLDRTVQAAIDAGSRSIVVVGTARPTLAGSAADGGRIVLTREDPPFGGPAAGIGAGMAVLDGAKTEPGTVVLVLACDLPEVGAALAPVLAALPLADGIDGVVLADYAGIHQPLTAAYDRAALASSLESRRRHAPLDGLSMRALIGDLRLRPVQATAGAADDIDTWTDAAKHGMSVPPEFASTNVWEES